MKKQLRDALMKKGFPTEFCDALVNQYLNTDYTQTRMLGYLYRYENPSMEEVVDEMLAIMSDRDAIIQKKTMEANQAKINEIYNRGLIVEEDQDEEDAPLFERDKKADPHRFSSEPEVGDCGCLYG